ncbi:cupin-like domain-containing protein [Paraburkholderia bryophila]|uniref:Cupin-like domain-containing protein n=1 Tax=Paraburkholderia bryophila TaxID=420952 RepID=A0A329D4H6_9BURK|nr:cupin-like domain-containing protein [Paraburkholderia bryophila]RAS39214.1 Cupin-like domain-containing protein [Paraburkholderia bryophila]
MVSRDAHAALSALLAARLAEHYVAPPQEVALDLIVSDCAEVSRRFLLGRSIGSVPVSTQMPARMPASASTPLPSGSAHPAAARITLNHALLTAMLDDPTGFDPRSATALALGGVRIDGSARLAAYWLQLLKRPSAAGRAALARARQRAPAFLTTVRAVSAERCNDNDLHVALADALDASEPLVLRGMIDWPEVSWTLDDWRRQEGSTVLRPDPSNGAPQTVAGFIDGIAAHGAADPGAATYTEGCLLPPLWEARFALPRLAGHRFGAGQLWFGRASGAALVTRLHCDLANSFLAQIHGRKRVRLYAPAQEDALYAFDSFNTYRPCRVDVALPDLTRFARFAQAQGVDVVLEPGDLLVIPTGWYHCVWALDHVLSVSRFTAAAAAVSVPRHGTARLP